MTYILDWVSDTASTQNILLLNGMAGSGKSTIATTIANHLRKFNQLGAFLFFDRDTRERNDPALVVRTLAYQLGSFHPPIGKSISTAIASTPTILLSPIRFQFDNLLVTPLTSLNLPPSSCIVFVLDALDECGTAVDREALLEVLTEGSVHLPSNFRFIVTSRADADIQFAFQPYPHILMLELSLTSANSHRDISTYFRYSMALIRRKKKRLGTDWPGKHNIQALTERAAGLFIWASTASRFINGHDPQKRLDIILQRNIPIEAESALNSLYQTALLSVGMWEDEDFVGDFRAIIGTVLVLRSPLSSTAIDDLLDIAGGRLSIETTEQLACVISSSPKVRFIHPSFSDFLLTRSRCGRDIWFFEKPYYNHKFALRCLQRLDSALERNMCNLTLSADSKNGTLAEGASYACLFWIDHLCMIGEDIQNIVAHLNAFLHRHVLHWFEAISILRRSRDSIVLLAKLLAWVTVSILLPFIV